MTQYPSLAKRVVFISGGAAGIGASLVEHFAAQGAKVAFCDIDQAAGGALVARLGASGNAPRQWHCDIRDIKAYQGISSRTGRSRDCGLTHPRPGQQRRQRSTTFARGTHARELG